MEFKIFKSLATIYLWQPYEFKQYFYRKSEFEMFIFRSRISAKIVAIIVLRMCYGNTAAHSFSSLLVKWRQDSHYNFSSEPHTPYFLVWATYSLFSHLSHILLIFSSVTPQNSHPSHWYICLLFFVEHFLQSILFFLHI